MMGSMLRRGAITTGCAATSEPNQVGGLTATASGQTTINLSWTADSTAAPNQATSYQVERSNDGLGSWTSIATGLTTNSYSDTSLSGSQTRYYRVTAYNCFGGALPSATANATTAAGSLSASSSIDWSSGTPSGYTFTRASTGTYVDSSGYIASANTDVARLTHNSSGTRLGLLVEESRTNRMTQSEDFSTANWSTGNCNVTTDATNAPTNTTVADKVAANTTNSAHWLRRSVTSPTTGTTYVYSVFFKAGGGAVSHVYLLLNGQVTAGDVNYGAKYDVTTGARTDTDSDNAPANTDSATQAEDYGNGWWRAWIRMEHPTGASGLRAMVGLANAATGAILPTFTGAAGDADFAYFWGAQVEASTTTPSSFIPTTTATVTRSADLAHVLDSSITSWGDPGALVVHFYPPGQAGTLLSTDDASTAQVGIEASSTTAARAFWSSGSTSTGTIGSGVQKAVHYFNGSTSKFCINGGTVQSGTNNLTIANTDFVTLGAEATDSGGAPSVFSQYANCVIRKVEFYSGTLTDANLQTITT